MKITPSLGVKQRRFLIILSDGNNRIAIPIALIVHKVFYIMLFTSQFSRNFVKNKMNLKIWEGTTPEYE